MTALEIVLLIIGIVILVASIIFQSNTGKKGDGSFFNEEELLEKEKNIIESFNRNLETTSEQMIVDCDDALSRISNEKILAMNEFADTNLNKISENHEHVVFLYNMLNTKDEEIKRTLAEMEAAKQNMKETVAEVVQITRQLNAAVKKTQNTSNALTGASSSLKQTELRAQTAKQSMRADAAKRETEKPKNDYKNSSRAMADEALGQMNLPEMMQSDNKNEEILKLHKQGKSILEISKSLNLGQGEVKLVIDLYGA